MHSTVLATLPSGDSRRNHLVMFFHKDAKQNYRMDISAIRQLRRRNLNALIDKMGGQAEFVKKTGMHQGLVSRLQNGKKIIGEELAESIEEKAGWPAGSLSSSAPDDPLDRMEVAMVESEDWLTAAERENFLGILKSMRGQRRNPTGGEM